MFSNVRKSSQTKRTCIIMYRIKIEIILVNEK